MPEKKSPRMCRRDGALEKPNGRALAKNDRGEVVALCDLIPERMEEFARELPGEQKNFIPITKKCAKPPTSTRFFVGTPNQWQCARRTRSRQKTTNTSMVTKTAIGL